MVFLPMHRGRHRRRRGSNHLIAAGATSFGWMDMTSDNAFAWYFSTDFGDYVGNWLLLRDDAGKEAFGFIFEPSDAEAYGAEQFTNGGFETAGGGGDDVFGTWTEFANGGSTVNDEGVDVHGGSHACRLDIDAGGNTAGVYQDVAATPGQCLRGICYCKISAAPHSTEWLFYDVTDAANIKTASPGALNYASGYEHICVPVGCNAVRVQFGIDTATSASIYFDDVSLKRQTAASFDGCKITSTSTGRTRAWAHEDDGFERNEDEYTYEIWGRRP